MKKETLGIVFCLIVGVSYLDAYVYDFGELFMLAVIPLLLMLIVD